MYYIKRELMDVYQEGEDVITSLNSLTRTELPTCLEQDVRDISMKQEIPNSLDTTRQSSSVNFKFKDQYILVTLSNESLGTDKTSSRALEVKVEHVKCEIVKTEDGFSGDEKTPDNAIEAITNAEDEFSNTGLDVHTRKSWKLLQKADKMPPKKRAKCVCPEARREANRRRKAERRANADPEEKARQRERDRIRHAAARSRETDEVKALRRERNRLRQAAAKANADPEEKARQRERDRIWHAAARSRETDEVKALRRERNRLRQAAARANADPEKKARQRERTRISHVAAKSGEIDKVLGQRLERQRRRAAAKSEKIQQGSCTGECYTRYENVNMNNNNELYNRSKSSDYNNKMNPPYCRDLNVSSHDDNSKIYLEQAHKGGKPNRKFACEVCGKTFQSNASFLIHFRIHTGEQPFQCHVCGMKCNTKGNLKTHIRIHTGEEPYRCDLCGKGFKQSASHLIHKISHIGETPYLCDMCGKTFTVRGNLQKHKRIHTGERPYLCDVCGKAFSDGSAFHKHTRIHAGTFF